MPVRPIAVAHLPADLLAAQIMVEDRLRRLTPTDQLRVVARVVADLITTRPYSDQPLITALFEQVLAGAIAASAMATPQGHA
jgi:hypothetical protein